MNVSFVAHVKIRVMTILASGDGRVNKKNYFFIICDGPNLARTLCSYCIQMSAATIFRVHTPALISPRCNKFQF